MYRSVFPTFLAFLLTAGSAGAEEMICKGNIISIQGEGMVTRTHRFEVSGISGCDVIAVLEKCKQIAQERQNRAVKKKPGRQVQEQFRCGVGMYPGLREVRGTPLDTDGTLTGWENEVGADRNRVGKVITAILRRSRMPAPLFVVELSFNLIYGICCR